MAKGSHATRGGWEPKTCHICGQPVRVTKDTAWFHYDHTTRQGSSVHMACHILATHQLKEPPCSPPSPT